MYQLKEYLAKELEQSKFLVASLEKYKYPAVKGTMVCKYRGGRIQYFKQYRTESKKLKQVYIGADDCKEVEMRKLKRYNQTLEKRLKSNIAILERVLPRIKDCTFEGIMNDTPNTYRDNTKEKYIKSIQIPNSIELSGTSNTYKMPDFPCIAIDGTPVRSKGEEIIYNLLKFYKIPFLYDNGVALTLKDGTKTIKYIDFIIKLPDGNRIYWEHLGMLENIEYSESVRSKIVLYHANGIVLGDNFFLTSDRCGGGLNSEQIDHFIKGVILPYFI